MTDDDQLMLNIQGGDSSAFEALVERHRGPLEGFFFRNTRDWQQAEDLAQDTLLRVFEQAWDYLPRGRFRGWMYRVARNLMIDSVRRQSRDALVHVASGRKDDEPDAMARLAAGVMSPEDVAHERELARLVDESLETIPEDQRLTFTLHHYAGLSLSEVADIMETTLPTSKSRLRLAREKMRQALDARGVTAASNADGNSPRED